MEEPQVKASITGLLAHAGLRSEALAVEPAGGGGNNRVFVVHTPTGKYLAKAYYSHPADHRNRLATEYAFLSYARAIGLQCVPRPMSWDPIRNMGLYEFIEGNKLTAKDLKESHIDQAATFFSQLNTPEHRHHADKLPIASEACFSILQHLAVIDRRLEKLLGMPVETPIDQEAIAFIAQLAFTWGEVKHHIQQTIGKDEMRIVLTPTGQCISPSDFGFHNALGRECGEVCFIDFEYAGWDDPAKALGDFFCQPAVPIPLDLFTRFATKALHYLPDAEPVITRASTLLPIFQSKWCCIMLNEFLPEAARRRRFANAEADPTMRKGQQLNKAKQFFSSTLQKTWPI